MTRPPNQHPGHPYWVRGCESCSGRMSPVSHQCQRDNQVRFRTLRRLQSQPHNQSNFAFVPLSLFLCFPFHLSHLYLLVEMLSTASRNFFIENTGASTLWMPRGFTSPTRSIRCQHSFPTTHWNHRLTSKTWCRCVFAASVASVGSATQPARTWSTKLSDSQMQRFWKDADQVHNQSESFTVSEAGLAGGGQPVVKVTQADSLTCDQK